MASELENHLNELAKKNPKAKILITQWEIERPILEEALTKIPRFFEHYSRHDATHSEKVLEKIGRFLGSKAISKLSATDTWLLLESAYWHDIGMLVSAKDIQRAENDSNFKAYIREIITGVDNELKSVVKCIFSEDGSRLFVEMTDENDNKRRQIIASYFRPKHASRSAEIIESSYKDYGINLVRPMEIEPRIINLLGEICKMHTKPFHEIVNNLPQEQDGSASDSFHPMFVACLLRIGDLLDLDNNRFSPTQTALSGMPPNSKQVHMNNHRSISEILTTPEKIAIVATPDNSTGGQIIESWFNMIREEINNLEKFKTTIVPKNLSNFIPIPRLDLTVKSLDETKSSINIEPALVNDMITIKGNTFIMGSPECEPKRRADEIQHQVKVNDFKMSKYPITQKEWVEVMLDNPCYFKGDNLPVGYVSWFDAIEYCNRRSEKEGLTTVYKETESGIVPDKKANGYRLPTEAEWEYACRAGTTTPFNTGENITTEQANYNGNFPYNNNRKGQNREKTTPVNSFDPNAWGLYDMHGNVWEWCWDWYGDYFSKAVAGTFRVIRGGGWDTNGQDLRSAFRSSYNPSGKFNSFGFRIVCSI